MYANVLIDLFNLALPAASIDSNHDPERDDVQVRIDIQHDSVDCM